MIDPLVHLLCRAGIALLFATASAHKLRDLRGFEAVLDGYALLPERLPERLLGLLARSVAAFEVFVAVGLLNEPTHRVAAFAAVALLSLYGVAISVNLLRGRRDIDCGCGGPVSDKGLRWSLVARNALLVAVAGTSLFPVGARTLGILDAMTFSGAIMVAALVWISAAALGAIGAPARGRL